MKPRSFITSVLWTIMIGAGSLEISKGLVNTFLYDIFRKCVDGSYEPAEFACQYGPQVLTNVFAGVLFFIFGAFLMKRLAQPLYGTLGVFIMAVAYTLLINGAWRMQVSLQDNFFIPNTGPVVLTEYLYLGFAWLKTVIVSAIVGALAWLGYASSRVAFERTEPRENFGGSKKSEVQEEKTAEKKPAAKTKKPATKKKTTAKTKKKSSK